ncbi:MAG: hypothetical protein LBG92_11940 [Prevotellaceae bacterium]|jgi:hypothetical protein|nr:hypothetical protein [Prevotellaceae bacterium]
MQKLKQMQQHANYGMRVMETETIQKNGTGLKSQTGSKKSVKIKITGFLFVLCVIAGMLASCGSASKLEKARGKQGEAKLKEYRTEGWKISGSSKTLEVAVLEHFEKLNDSNNREFEGSVSMCKSVNVCIRKTAVKK